MDVFLLDFGANPSLFIALPFLVRSEFLLSPLLPLFITYIISLLGFNVARHVLHAYFH